MGILIFCLKFIFNSFIVFIYDDVISIYVDIFIVDCIVSGEIRICIV